MAVPPASAGGGQRRRPDRALRRRAVSGLLQHPGSGGHRRAAGLHSRAARAGLRRLVAPAVGARHRRQAQSRHAPHRVAPGRGPAGSRALLRHRPSLSPARRGAAAAAPAGHGARRRHQRPPARHRPARARSVVAPGARHADLDDHRPHRGHPVGGLRHRAGRHLGLRGRHARSRHPAGDRAAAVAAHDPHLAGADGGAAARLVAPAGLLRHHGDPVAGGLDHARPRGARTVPGPARGGLRAGRRSGRGQPPAHHRPPHGAELPAATSSPPARWPSRP